MKDTIVCLGTGPSLTLAQVEAVRSKGFSLAGCNRTWEIVPDLEFLYGCNLKFWEHYWSDSLAKHPAQKWTTNAEAANRFGLNWIGEKDKPGLSIDPSYVHHGHGSGYSLLNLVYLLGAKRVILLGYDMKYAPDYDGYNKRIGESPRHYFGEYPVEMQHWPKVKVKDGVHFGLVELYESVARQNLVEIINCTPGSAITCFPSKDIADVV